MAGSSSRRQVLLRIGQGTKTASIELAAIGTCDALDSAEIWDPATRTFSPTGSLTQERSDHSATLLRDGRVLLAGNWSTYGFAHTAEVFELR